MKKSKKVLFIDGSNLYGGMTDVLKPGEYLDFASFINFIKQDFSIDQIMFYGTYMIIDETKSLPNQLRGAAQNEFFNQAKSYPIVKFYKGHFSGSGKEKGIDVHLALDLVVGAIKDKFDEAIIMTGDADLLYAVQLALEEGKKIHLAAFCSRFPYGISFRANRRVVYDYEHFFERSILPQYKIKPYRIEIRDASGKVKVNSVDKGTKRPSAHHAG